MSYLGHSLKESYPAAELQSVYSTAPTDWVKLQLKSFQICRYISYPLTIQTNKRIIKTLLFIIRPTNARMWHKAVFKVGPVAGPKPTRVRQGQKYLRPRRHSAILPPYPEGDKSLGDAPWGQRNYPVPMHTWQNHTEVRRPTNNWRGKVANALKERPGRSLKENPRAFISVEKKLTLS